MKRIILSTTAAFAFSVSGQESAHPPIPQEEAGQTLPSYISQIAEAGEISGIDYHNMAAGTLQVANAVKQQGQQLPESVLHDALNAVAAGRELSPELDGWDEIERQLLELLNPPEEDQQQQQEQQNSDQENSENREGEQNQDQEGQSGEQDQQESQDGEQSQQDQDGQQEQNGEEDQQQDQDSQSQDGENQDQQNPEDGQSGEQSQDGQEGELPPAKDGAQMGELEQPEEQQDVQLDGQEDAPQESPPEEMQTLGGQQTAGEPIQADKAAIRQMLEQLKQQDEPGKLYKILQEAQQGERKKSQPNAKDW